MAPDPLALSVASPRAAGGGEGPKGASAPRARAPIPRTHLTRARAHGIRVGFKLRL